MSWPVGKARHACGPCAEKEGEEQQGWGWAAAFCLLSPGRQAVPEVAFPSHPTGVPGGTGRAGATEYMWTELWEHVLLPRSCLPPSLRPRRAETVNTRFADAPWQDLLGTPQTGGDCSPTQLSKRCEQSVTLFLCHATKSSLGPHNFPAFLLFLNSTGSLPWVVWTSIGL